MRTTITVVLTVLSSAISALCDPIPRTQYDNDFVDPNIIFSNNNTLSTSGARQTVIQWADQLAALGPFSVLNKTVLPPSGNKKDYMSWAPYFWPNCSNVHNTTELPQEEVWVKCNYAGRDGQFNPDRLLVNDTSNFGAMADGVFYNTLAWVFTGNQRYSDTAARFMNTWFIDPQTSMNPNLEYAQMQRGPKGQVGTHTGVLDLKLMSKVASALLILRQGKSVSWSSAQDTSMNAWITSYVNWLLTNDIGTQELAAENNHGTYMFNQLGALYIVLGDKERAKNITMQYFNGIYQNQITATGEQPLEAARTHPYHYRNYNIAAMIVNARIAEYLGIPVWDKTTKLGGTIKKAVDVAMVQVPAKDGDGPLSEIYSSITAVGSVYGDKDKRYANFLAQADPTYPAQPYFLWNQPFSDSNLAAATATSSSISPSSTSSPRRTGSGTSLAVNWSFIIALGFMTLLY